MTIKDLTRAVWWSAAVVASGVWAAAEPVETVVVTAAPPDPVGNGAFSVVRLDAAALGTSPQLDEALSQVPGLSLFRRNSSLSANPTTQGLSLRSIAPSGAGRALVTLDGVPQNDPFGGWVIWSALPPEDIAEAQIVRGAGAGPYGAGALTGVVALKEASSGWRASASGGSLGQRRAAAAGGVRWGKVSLFGLASEMASDGWIPAASEQRGAADDKLTIDARNVSLRAQIEPDEGTLISARFSAYRESRQSGLIDTQSLTNGLIASLTAAHPVTGDAIGWRLQVWLHNRNFSQTSAAVATDRMSVTPSNNQYATPSLGWGGNAALRGSAFLDWEIGADIRASRGNAKEQIAYVSGAFTQGRVSGGKTLIGGLYAEAARRNGEWLLTLGVRADAWQSSGGHVIQTSLTTGAVISSDRFPSRSGVLPTFRAGLRRDFDSFHLRTAAYEGFRAPSLNELYRPFRLGNNITVANPSLAPEKLYGVEIGAGGTAKAFIWNLTLFWNRLHAAVTNVTIGHGPGTFPGVGALPAGGLLVQRQNVGDINAPGIEGGFSYAFDELTLHAAFDLLDPRIHGGTAALQLTGKRPSQAPRATITGGAEMVLPFDLIWSASVRYESSRWADDANTLLLGSAVTVNSHLSWAMSNNVSFYVSADNVLNSRVATTKTADGIASYGAPRTISAGVEFKS